MTTRQLWLPLDPGQPAICLTLDANDRVLAREQTTPDSPASGTDAPTLLVVPGLEARAVWLPLAARSPAQALAEARALVLPQLAGASDDLHIAVAPTTAVDAPRLVVLVERARLQDWLDRARALGVEPVAVTPDHLMLADDSEAATVLDRGSHWAVRAGTLAFSAEPALARQVLGDRAVRHLGTVQQAETLLAAAAPPINLLQVGASRIDAGPARRGYRRAAWLAAALVLSPALLIGAQALRHAVAHHLLQQQAAARVAEVLPSAAPVADPAAYTAQALAALQAPERLARIAGALFDAVAQLDGAHLTMLRYHDGQVEAEIVHPQAQDAEALLATLAESGIDAQVLDSRQHTDGRLSRVRLEDRQ